jgi:hypothetical protein
MDDAPRRDPLEPTDARAFTAAGAIGGSLLPLSTGIANARTASTPPPLRHRVTKHPKLSTKYFPSFFMFLHPM